MQYVERRVYATPAVSSQRAASFAAARVCVRDSASSATLAIRGDILVCGSHAGTPTARFAAASWVKGLIANDAGIGKEQAGIAGLDLLDLLGIPAAAVDHRTARIGDGRDTLASGVVSHVNRPAAAAGVRSGMAARDAARLLATCADRSLVGPVETAMRAPTWRAAGSRSIVMLDSISQVDPSMARAIVVTGSHGGVIASLPLQCPLGGAIFNDAGGGKQRAGFGRLRALDEIGVPAATVACVTARIGDGLDTFASGVLSHINQTAEAFGVRAGQRAAVAARVLARRDVEDRR